MSPEAIAPSLADAAVAASAAFPAVNTLAAVAALAAAAAAIDNSSKVFIEAAATATRWCSGTFAAFFWRQD